MQRRPPGAGRPRPGRRCRLNADQKGAVASWLEEGPDPEACGLARWRLCDLRDRILDTFGVGYCIEAVRLLARDLGYSFISPRPCHPKVDRARQEAFRKDFETLAHEAVPDGTDPESIKVWWNDEARAGQKGLLSRVWARTGTRPPVPRDQRYGYAYLFGAANGARGVMSAPGRHAVLVLDGAGWHRSRDLKIPDNVSLLRLPPYSPELNPMENIFSFIKSNYLSNQVFPTVSDVRQALERSWDLFIGEPGRIRSIVTRAYASAFTQTSVAEDVQQVKT